MDGEGFGAANRCFTGAACTYDDEHEPVLHPGSAAAEETDHEDEGAQGDDEVGPARYDGIVQDGQDVQVVRSGDHPYPHGQKSDAHDLRTGGRNVKLQFKKPYPYKTELNVITISWLNQSFCTLMRVDLDRTWTTSALFLNLCGWFNLMSTSLNH